MQFLRVYFLHSIPCGAVAYVTEIVLILKDVLVIDVLAIAKQYLHSIVTISIYLFFLSVRRLARTAKAANTAKAAELP